MSESFVQVRLVEIPRRNVIFGIFSAFLENSFLLLLRHKNFFKSRYIGM